MLLTPSSVLTSGNSFLIRRIPFSVSIPALRNSSSPGAERERERVENQVVRSHPVLSDDQIVDALRAMASFSSARLRHSLFIDRQGNHRGAVLLAERHDPVDPFLAIFKIDRIDDRLAADQLQGFLDNGRLRRIDHDRQLHLRVEAVDDLPHVARFIPADVRGADVDHMRALLAPRRAPWRRSLPNLPGQADREIVCSRSHWCAPRSGRGAEQPEGAGLIEAGRARNEVDFPFRGASPPTASTSFRMCRRVVPQHPPTTLTPRSRTKWERYLVNSSGVSE